MRTPQILPSSTGPAQITGLAQLSSSQNQVASRRRAKPISINQVDLLQSMSLIRDGLGVSVQNAGIYEVIAAPQVARFPRCSTAPTSDFDRNVLLLDVWLTLNGVDVPNSGVRISMFPKQTDVIVTQGLITCNVGDVLQVLMHDATPRKKDEKEKKSDRIGLVATRPKIGPLIPSLILTIIGFTQVATPI